MKVRASLAGVVLPALLAITASSLTGCKKEHRLFEKVDVSISDNLEVVRLALVFTDRVKLDHGATLGILDYGVVFLHPYTGSMPFQVGFDLNTRIVNEQKFIDLEPTTVLPNGVPIGIPYAVVEVSGEGPIHDKFDLYGYVDVLKQSWLGAAGIFGFIDEKYFPQGLSISQVFLRDDAGAPAILAAVFGPVKNGDGTLQRAGGVAILANVRHLIEKYGNGANAIGGKTLSFKPEAAVHLAGPNASLYEGRYDRLLNLKNRFIERANAR